MRFILPSSFTVTFTNTAVFIFCSSDVNIKRPILSSGPDSVIVKPKAFTGKVNYMRFLFVIHN